jgi:hypothetical protein
VLLTLQEIDAALVDAKSRWDGIGQAVAMEIRSLNRERAELFIELGGCCGQQVVDTVEASSNGVSFERTTYVECRYTCEPCPAAAIGCRFAGLPELNNVLNEVMNLEPLA